MKSCKKDNKSERPAEVLSVFVFKYNSLEIFTDDCLLRVIDTPLQLFYILNYQLGW